MTSRRRHRIEAGRHKSVRAEKAAYLSSLQVFLSMPANGATLKNCHRDGSNFIIEADATYTIAAATYTMMDGQKSPHNGR
jgi:hypothetical protein